MSTQSPTRKRDPHRKRAILNSAARLVADRGYAGVTMADIGTDIGITASALYWHYSSKQALLVALFDDCLDRLLGEQRQAIEGFGRTLNGLTQITRLQVDFVVEERSFAKVYYREAPHMPAGELARLQDKQRIYVEAWARLLHDLRPDLTSPSAPDELVHAAIGAVQSTLVYRSKSSMADHHGLLLGAAMRVQGF